MSGAREQILARARAGLARAEAPDVPRTYRSAGSSELGRSEMLALFEQRVADYGAGVRRSLTEALEVHRPRRVAVAPGLAVETGAVELVVDDPPLAVEELERLDGVITGCALAIAQTGTIVLDGGELSGRRALTLVPDLHVCVVGADQVVAAVPDAIDALAERRLHTAALTFVSGPSATSDIGFERVEGVHGPRRLEVVVVE